MIALSRADSQADSRIATLSQVIVLSTFDGVFGASMTLFPHLSRNGLRKSWLLESGTAMGDVALRRIEEMLQQQFPTVETHFYHGGLPASAEVLKQAAAESDVIIGATAD